MSDTVTAIINPDLGLAGISQAVFGAAPPSLTKEQSDMLGAAVRAIHVMVGAGFDDQYARVRVAVVIDPTAGHRGAAMDTMTVSVAGTAIRPEGTKRPPRPAGPVRGGQRP